MSNPSDKKPSYGELLEQLAVQRAENETLAAQLEQSRQGPVARSLATPSRNKKLWAFEVEYTHPRKGSLGKQTIQAVDESEACRLYLIAETKDGKLVARKAALTPTEYRPHVKCLDPKREQLRVAKYEAKNAKLRELNMPTVEIPRGADDSERAPQERELEAVA